MPTTAEEFERLAAAIADGQEIDWTAVEADGRLSAGELRGLRDLEALRVSPASQRIAALEPGNVLGDFRLERLIGQGGMGQVWEAVQLSLGRRVALKLVRPERITPRQLELFAREARAGGRLSHSGLVSVHQYGQTGGVAWIAMELVPGSRTVRDLLVELSRREEAPSGDDRELARLVATIAEAMQAAHAAGVVHRDLKPENILLAPDGHPKVSDFGLARVVGDEKLSISGEVVGTCRYMSPEQTLGRPGAVDLRTDVFSLGVVLYELLARRPPFEGDTSFQVIEKIRTHDPVDPRTIRSRIPHDLAVVCMRALEKDPVRRYPSMAELAADLQRFLAGEPIHARPPSRIYRASKWVRRNPARAATAGIAIGSFLAISALLVVNLRTNQKLGVERNQLAKSNTALEEKTREAERSSALAREQTQVAEKRLTDVLRLSALQRLKELNAQADRLWPAAPDLVDEYVAWIDSANELVARLPEYRHELEELRVRGRPLSEDERQRGIENHPRLAELERERRRLASLERFVAVVGGAAQPVEPSLEALGLDPDALPAQAEEARRLAWSLVDPDRTEWGGEALGLLLARRALELARPEVRSSARSTLAWALLANGRVDEALEEAEHARNEAEPVDEPRLAAELTAMIATVEDHTSTEGILRDGAELERMKQAIAAREAQLAPSKDWSLASEQDRWLSAQLEEMVSGLEALAHPETGLLSPGVSEEHGWGVPRRLEFAREIGERSITGPEPRTAWAEAIASISDDAKCPAYRGLRIVPQLGLLPIGRDPESGLWEFVHLQSGEAPGRDAAGRLELSEAMGIVLVLLPGGPTWLGSQSADPHGRNYFEEAAFEEGPVHEAVLSPFFLSKFEMTQAQWMRACSRNPSYVSPQGWRRDQSRFGGWSALHPVEQVNWWTCTRTLERLGLELPTEAQWEYGARAGTGTPWWCGTDRSCIARSGNVADQYAREHGGSSWAGHEPWDDGAAATAPVGSYLPNAFGLHDVIGNVWEWCRDSFRLDAYPRRTRFDPVSEERASRGERIWRGGGCNELSEETRSGFRGGVTPENAIYILGVRPARALERPAPEQRLVPR